MKEKWSRLFASKRYHTKDGIIKLTPLEQQEILDDIQQEREKWKEVLDELKHCVKALKVVNSMGATAEIIKGAESVISKFESNQE